MDSEDGGEPVPGAHGAAMDGVGDTSGADHAVGAELPAGEDEISLAPWLAMRIRMHSHRRLEPGDEGRIRRRWGEDDDAVYVIDDGPDHCMVGRRVGQAPDCVYCLVGRISSERYEDIEVGDLDWSEVFADARDISLCGVVEEEEAAANVFLVQHYRRARQVPVDYLPGSPLLEFTDDPDGES
ncbi:MAG TPA: hypothetical protein VMU64_03740 [Acidimicrobiales bacterium]|nr:hypothetical protein [Acidimicrobiales bacterium]